MRETKNIGTEDDKQKYEPYYDVRSSRIIKNLEGNDIQYELCDGLLRGLNIDRPASFR